MTSEKIKETLEKIPFLMILGIYIFYLGYDYYIFNTDETSPLQMKNREINSAKENKGKFEKKLKEFQAFAKTLDVKKVELRALAKELQGVKDALSEKTDVPAFMKMTITEAKKAGLTVLSLKPEGSSAKEYYVEQTFSFRFKGLFPQLLSFVQRLANVTEIVRVDKLEVQSVASNQSEKFALVQGSLDIKTYKYIGTSADTMGNSDAPPQGGEAQSQTAKGVKVGAP